MGSTLSRRDFLKLAAASASGLAFRPPPPDLSFDGEGLMRVATSWIGLYAEPSFRARRLARLERDQLVTVLKRELSGEGPTYNPLWVQLAGGYAHSGHLQPVRWLPQTPRSRIKQSGELFEVSVPFTRSYREPSPAAEPLYRLYYQSTAWVEDVGLGEDGRSWYRLVDDLLKVRYFVRAEHLRWIPPEELKPVSPEIPLHRKRLEVSLARQELLAYEEDRLMLRTSISTGIMDPKPRGNGIPTMTPRGRFYVDKKMPLRHMGDGQLTADLEAYELPGVPWVSFFHFWGVAFHGTYWHSNYGTPMSHGCVNMRPEEAKWLYRWTLPAVEHDRILHIGHGTTVDVV